MEYIALFFSLILPRKILYIYTYTYVVNNTNTILIAQEDNSTSDQDATAGNLKIHQVAINFYNTDHALKL